MAFLRADLAQFAAYKSPHPIEEAAAKGDITQPVLDPPVLDPLDTNESPIDLPAALKDDLARAYRDAIAANRYPDSSHHALKQAIIRYAISSSDITSDAIGLEHVTIGNGSDELIRSVLMATCLGNNGSILVATPTFSMYGILAKTLGITVHQINRTDTFAVDPSTASAAIQQAKQSGPPVKAVFMVHPNSPTGNALTQQELTWLKQIPDNVLIVVDEAYFEFSGHTTLLEALSRPNWLVLRTFSKAFRLAAHRVGYGIGHPDIITALEKLRLPYNLPSFSQAAAKAALAHSEQLLQQIPDIILERQRVSQALSAHPYLQTWPSHSNFVYARLSPKGLAALEANGQADGLAKTFQQLKAKGTLIRHTGGGLRISIGTAAENQRTLANFKQVFGYK